MSNSKRKYQKFTFSNKRISLNAIREMAKLLADEADKLKSDGSSVILEYLIDKENESCSDISPTLFHQEQGEILNGFVKKVVMTLECKDNYKCVKIILSHTFNNSSDENVIEVGSSDNIWGPGVSKSLNNTIEKCQNQFVLKDIHGLLLFFAVIGFNFLYFKNWYAWLISSPNGLGIFFIICMPLITIICALKLWRVLCSLWPVVELETGEEYQREALVSRRKVQGIIGTFIFPLAIALIPSLFPQTFGAAIPKTNGDKGPNDSLIHTKDSLTHIKESDSSPDDNGFIDRRFHPKEINLNGVPAIKSNVQCAIFKDSYRIVGGNYNRDLNQDSNWVSNFSANIGDTVSLAIVFANTGAQIARSTILKLSLGSPSSNGRKCSFKLNANNCLEPVQGQISINVGEPIRLEYYWSGWLPQGHDDNSSESLPKNQNGSEVLSKNGLDLGSIDLYEKGANRNVFLIDFIVRPESY